MPEKDHPANEEVFPNTVIAVPGGMFNRDQNGNYVFAQDTIYRAQAAAELLRGYPHAFVLILAQECVADGLKEIVERKAKRIAPEAEPRISVITNNDSIAQITDTAKKAAEVNSSLVLWVDDLSHGPVAYQIYESLIKSRNADTFWVFPNASALVSSGIDRRIRPKRLIGTYEDRYWRKYIDSRFGVWWEEANSTRKNAFEKHLSRPYRALFTLAVHAISHLRDFQTRREGYDIPLEYIITEGGVTEKREEV